MRKTRLLDFHKIDFRSCSFDAVIMFGNNFGLFFKPVDRRVLLKKLFVMTSVSGVVICESLDLYNTGDAGHIAYQRENRRRNRMGEQVRIRV